MLLYVPYQDQIPGRLGLAPTVRNFWRSSVGSLHPLSCQLEGLRSCGGFVGTPFTVGSFEERQMMR